MTINLNASLTAKTDAELTEEVEYQQRQIGACKTDAGIERRTGQLARAQAEQNRRKRA